MPIAVYTVLDSW